MSTWDCYCGRVNEGYEKLCTLCGWENKENQKYMNKEFKYRELMFRAWSTKKNEFLATGFHIIGETTLFDLLNQHRIEELDTLHIQQSTGVKDINDKDIYEGDIVEDYQGNRSVVRWFTTKEGYDWDGWFINGVKVVGNIFETED